MSAYPDSGTAPPLAMPEPLQPGRYGIALQILGNGAEHIAASTTYSDDPQTPAEQEAVRILLKLSREVFDEYTRTNTRSAFRTA
jgi:hypothetical protein